MTYIVWTFASVWFSVALFILWRHMNLMRLMFNNLAPGANVSGPEAGAIQKVMTPNIKPELFNEVGQAYLRQWNRNGLLFFAWSFIGFLSAIWLSTYFTVS